MVKIFLCFLSLVFLLVGCSHQVKKEQSSAPKIGFMKIRNYGKASVKRRTLASDESIPGAEDFYRAIKEFGFAFVDKEPIGFEVIWGSNGQVDGQPMTLEDKPQHLEKTVYLKQNKFGVFYLSSRDDGPIQFTLIDTFSLANYTKDEMLHLFNSQFKEIKKISPHEFIVVREEDGGICESKVDLKKSSSVSNDETCKDASGNLISSYRFLSMKPINVTDYLEKLKSTKLRVEPSALNQICLDQIISNTGDNINCESSVLDEVERDWSFILK